MSTSASMSTSHGSIKGNWMDDPLPLHCYWLLDISGSMAQKGKIETLNNAIIELIPLLQEAQIKITDVVLSINIIVFSDTARRHLFEVTPVSGFHWEEVIAEGETQTGAAISLVTQELSQTDMNKLLLPPIVILATDGRPTDDFDTALREFMESPQGERSIRVALAIGKDADISTLEKFIGPASYMPPVRANRADTLVAYIQGATLSVLRQACNWKQYNYNSQTFTDKPFQLIIPRNTKTLKESEAVKIPITQQVQPLERKLRERKKQIKHFPWIKGKRKKNKTGGLEMNYLGEKKLHNEIIDVLPILINQHSMAILDNPQKFENIMMDLCGKWEREIILLTNALKDGIHRRLLNLKIDLEFQIDVLSWRLRDKYLINREPARWAVLALAWGLGRISHARWLELTSNPKTCSPEPELSFISLSKGNKKENGILKRIFRAIKAFLKSKSAKSRFQYS